ncbi:MAG: polysaccharide deacetylase family protein [Oscillospiraceae bacterium]|nr:polysaccharide deacetylase family protein [Oscillospiraceae bacterium]
MTAVKKLIAFVLVLAVLSFAGCSERAAIQELLSEHAGGQQELVEPVPQLLAVELPPVVEEPVYEPEEDLTPEPEQSEYNAPPVDGGRRSRLNIDMRGAKMVALTFDDGPIAVHTDRILDLLEEHGGRATFFVQGYRVASHSEIIQRTVRLGSEVAGHSWNHQDYSLIEDEAVIEADIRSTSEAIRAVGGNPPAIYRPPFGRTNNAAEQASARLGYAIINWTLDTRDWEHRDPDIVYDSIMRTVESGDIIVMHDVHGSTAEAMERVIPALIEQGFELVTVTELLTHAFGELEPGVVYGRNYNRN